MFLAKSLQICFGESVYVFMRLLGVGELHLVENWKFAFSFSLSSLLCIQTFSMDPTVYAIRDLD